MIYVYEAGPYEQAELIQIVHPIHQWILWTQLRLLHHYIIILYYSLNALLYSQLNIYHFLVLQLLDDGGCDHQGRRSVTRRRAVQKKKTTTAGQHKNKSGNLIP